MHNQAYRPTAEEAGGHGSYGSGGVNAAYGGGVAGARPDGLQRTETSERRMKLEGKVRDMEGKAGKYLKKLDKLW